jgi:hypothetical protein
MAERDLGGNVLRMYLQQKFIKGDRQKCFMRESNEPIHTSFPSPDSTYSPLNLVPLSSLKRITKLSPSKESRACERRCSSMRRVEQGNAGGLVNARAVQVMRKEPRQKALQGVKVRDGMVKGGVTVQNRGRVL